MTKYLLESVFGSGNDQLKSVQSGSAKNAGPRFLPGVYMIRRENDLDEITFNLYRYANPVSTKHNTSRGLIEIELIETSSENIDDMVKNKRLNVENLSQNDVNNESCKISATLSYQIVDPVKQNQLSSTDIVGGKLLTRDASEATVISDQVYFNKPTSPVKFCIALDNELSEKLWSLYEESQVTLELSINWVLSGEEYGKTFEHEITQKIPLLTSMTAQRRCFRKYETWADEEHDFTELNVQCFSFLMENKHGISKVQVIVAQEQGTQVSVQKLITFDESDLVSSKVVAFETLKDVDQKRFNINVIYHFDDASTKETGWVHHGLRYFDATYK